MSEIIPLFIEAIRIENDKIYKKTKQKIRPTPYDKDFIPKVMRRFAWFSAKTIPNLKSIKFVLNKESHKIEITFTTNNQELMGPYIEIFDEFIQSAYYQQLAKNGEFVLNVKSK